jgi:hypothetical protein
MGPGLRRDDNPTLAFSGNVLQAADFVLQATDLNQSASSAAQGHCPRQHPLALPSSPTCGADTTLLQQSAAKFAYRTAQTAFALEKSIAIINH